MVSGEGEACLHAGSGYDGVRDPRRRVGCYRDFGYFGVPTTLARALGRNRQQHKRLIADEGGQATVEYVVVLAGVLCVVVGLGALFNAFESGLVVRHAVSSASHHVVAGSGWLLDVFAY